MKKFFLLVLVLCFISSLAQEGVRVIYKHTTTPNEPNKNFVGYNKDSTVTLTFDSQVKKELSSHIDFYELKSTKTESSFKLLKTDTVEIFKGLKTYTPDYFLYKNLTNNSYLQKEHFWNKNYVISDSLDSLNWEISKETENILGYKTFKAKAKGSDYWVDAWYVPSIEIKSGPGEYGGLPGLILKVVTHYKNVTFHTTAKKILLTQEKLIIEKPKRGRVVSKKKYDKIVEKKIR